MTPKAYRLRDIRQFPHCRHCAGGVTKGCADITAVTPKAKEVARLQKILGSDRREIEKDRLLFQQDVLCTVLVDGFGRVALGLSVCWNPWNDIKMQHAGIVD